MASIIKASINLNEIPKDKIIVGKKGKYLPITITLNDEPDQFGNQGPIVVAQSKEERETKTAKTYLGNVRSSPRLSPRLSRRRRLPADPEVPR